jgi:small-conductance mechanosensitive channel
VATWTGLTAGLAAFYAFVPHLIGAILILLIGWGVSSLLYTLTDKILDTLRFDALMARIGVDDAIARSGVRIEPSNLVATLVKWAVLLVTFMMAAEQLGLTQVSLGIAAILAYIPNVIAAVVILTLGILLANFVSGLVRGTGARLGVRASEILADLSYWAIVVFAALGAIGQLNIAPTLVQTLYTAVIAMIALAGALAFGLGLRNQARDVVAGRAIMDQLHVGDEVTLSQGSGRIEKIGTVKTLIMTASGLLSIPNHMLTDEVLRIGRMAPVGGGGGPAGKIQPAHNLGAGGPIETPSSAPEDFTADPGTLRPQQKPWRPEDRTP